MAATPVELVGYEVRDRVAHLTLNRPPLNVLNLPMLRQMEAGLGRAAAEPGLAALLVGAEGGSFCAGVDVAEHGPEFVEEMIPLFDRVCRRLAEFPAPTVARVQGTALGGGCELVACCDFAWMASGARIGQPEIQLGVFPPVAALLLPALVGPRWAARLVLAGETVGAEQAALIGLISEAVLADSLGAAVDALLDRLRSLSAAALRATVQALRMGVAGWATRLPEVEDLYLNRLMRTDDAVEGLRSFLEKRKPIWNHRWQ